MNYGIILAAGKGTRMKSENPKCAFKLLEKPMVEYVTDSLFSAGIDEIVTVIGYKGEVIKDILNNRVQYVEQKEQLGTGHAVMQTIPFFDGKKGKVIIAFGDVPLISKKTLLDMLNFHEKSNSDLTILSALVENPFGYGRIIRDKNDNVIKIVEQKDASKEEQMINEVNASLYILDSELLISSLRRINNNNSQNEYYLTDILEILVNDGKIVKAFTVENNYEVEGINDRVTLNRVEEALIDRIKENHINNGLLITNPKSVVIGPDVVIDLTVCIKPNTYIFGKTTVKKNSVIGPNCQISNSYIGENSNIVQSDISDSKIGNFANIGPYARIRNNAYIGNNTRVGNFVEIKNTNFGNYSKSAHLSYIGDSEVGQNVNFGCGTITVNYDGNKKFKTIIKDNAFIGCNSNLIAPVEIGKDTYIAAGSTINKNVPDESLAIARSKQVNKEGYATRIKKKLK